MGITHSETKWLEIGTRTNKLAKISLFIGQNLANWLLIGFYRVFSLSCLVNRSLFKSLW